MDLSPQVAEEISGPLTSTKKITLVSSGSGAVGAAKVTGEVLDILSHLPESVERLTGISISQVRTSQLLSVPALSSHIALSYKDVYCHCPWHGAFYKVETELHLVSNVGKLAVTPWAASFRPALSRMELGAV